MKKRGIYLLLLLMIVYNTRTFGDNNIIKVKNIRFFGLKYESEYAIMKQVRSKVTENAIIIDVKSLENVLQKTPIIEKYTIGKKNDYLEVHIVEKKPVILIGLKKGTNLDIYEMDARFTVIAKNSAHIYKPLIIIEKERYNREQYNKMLLERVKKYYLLCMQVMEKLPFLYRELSEIYVKHGSANGNTIVLEIRLHNRKPVFIMQANMHNFIKLNYVAGYLDRTNFSPEKVKISGNKIVLR